MKLLIDTTKKECYRSVSDDHPDRLPDFTVGDIVPISVALAPRIINQWDTNLFAPIDVSGYTIRAALGGFKSPTSGTFPVTYSAQTSALRVPFNPAALDLEVALNLIDAIDDLGGLDVTGDDGFFTITWRLVGSRSLIQASATDLIPISVIEIAEKTAGSVSVREVQTLRIRQDTGAVATLGTSSSSPAITVTEVTAGDATHNAKVRLTFPADRWGGTWTFTANSGTSDLIGYSASQEQMQAAIEAMTVIGTGNVSVNQETELTYLVMFKNGRGLQAISSISADGTTLKVIGTKSGSLDLTTAAVSYLIPAGEESALVSLEIEATPSGGSAEKVLERDVILRRSVIPVGS